MLLSIYIKDRPSSCRDRVPVEPQLAFERGAELEHPRGCVDPGLDIGFAREVMVRAIGHAVVEARATYIKDRAHKILAAGATFADDGKTVESGCYIVEMDRDEVKDFVAKDPFTLAGIRESTVIPPWIKACFNREFFIASKQGKTDDYC